MLKHECHSNYARFLRATCVAVLLFGFAMILGAVPVAHASTIAVDSVLDTSGDSNICTLRDAIIAANTNAVAGGCPAGSPYPTVDTISISQSRQVCLPNPSACIIVLSSPLPAVSEDVTITGVTGALKWTPTISGANAYRVFDLGAVTVNISNLNIINGNATGISTAGYGGAIKTSDNDTTLTVSNVYFSGNHAQHRGGALHVSGGTTTVNNSTFFSNTVDDLGGAIEQYAGILIITGSTLSGNSADLGYGGGIGVQGSSDTRLTNVTISGNKALIGGGGISRFGLSPTIMSLNNVTISNNTADSNNDGSGDGGGIYRGSGTVTAANTIIAGNFDTPNNSGTGTIHPDCSWWPISDTLTSFGYNLLGRSDGCAGLTNGVNGDKVGTNANPLNALLGPPAWNGGSTQTHALLPGSPAIDAGNPLTPGGGGFGACAAIDQRGVTRPIGSQCDMGAYEAPPYLKLFLPLITK